LADLHGNPLAPDHIAPFSVIRGDFNADGVVNAADIDILATAARGNSTDLSYDLDGDALVTWQSDADVLVLDILHARFGDANLDSRVEYADFQTVLDHYNQHGGATWENGDFTGDGNVDYADFQILLDNWSPLGY
jgi:hypothetical protein